jgi:hypothetical protein
VPAAGVVDEEVADYPAADDDDVAVPLAAVVVDSSIDREREGREGDEETKEGRRMRKVKTMTNRWLCVI